MIRHALLAAALAAQPALAQEQPQPQPGEDWVVTQPDRKTVAAVAAFSNGIGIIARCQDGVYDLMIAGLPEAPRREYTRELGLQVADEIEARTTVWSVGTERTTAFSRLPALVARQLAKGGKLQLIVPGEEGGRRTRYVMELAPSSTALERTLNACDRPLVDPRDETLEGNGQPGLPQLLEWAQRPEGRYPGGFQARGITEGYAVVSCGTTSEGALTDCQIESEQPTKGGAGEAVLRSLVDARVRLTPEAVAAGERLENRFVSFTTNFRLD
jgi:hypothetical protein